MWLTSLHYVTGGKNAKLINNYRFYSNLKFPANRFSKINESRDYMSRDVRVETNARSPLCKQ